MTDSVLQKIGLLKTYLNQIDEFSGLFNIQIQNIVEGHKKEGGNLEYVYVEHFHNEIRGLSKLFQYLLQNNENKKYIFFPVRASIEVLLYLEYVLGLAKSDKNKILKLLSTDLAQSATAINEAASTDEGHPIYLTLNRIDMANKILKTGFDLSRVKSNTKPFPDMRSLCDKSQLSLKDSQGSDIYHLYRAYSESNHLRLGNEYSISKDIDVDICWALEYFIEIYIKFYEQIINFGSFPDEFRGKLAFIKKSLGIV